MEAPTATHTAFLSEPVGYVERDDAATVKEEESAPIGTWLRR